MRLFSILRDLDPSFLPPTWELLQQEVLKLRTGAAVIPFMSHLNQTSTRYEIERLANGVFDQRAERFIRGREEEVRRNLPHMSQAYLAHVKQVKESFPEKYQALRTFRNTAAYFSDQFPNIVREILRGSVSQQEATEMSARLDSFPALRSSVHANVYLCFIHIAHGTKPAPDKIDDYRHTIDASYSSAIVTGDGQLAKTATRLNPDLKSFLLEITESGVKLHQVQQKE